MKNHIQLSAPLRSFSGVLFLIFLLTPSAGVVAQTSLGFQLARGEITGYSKVNYRYTPTIIQFQTFTSVRKNIEFVLQRQVSFATFEDVGGRQRAWEAGLNLGVVLHTEIYKKITGYVLGSTGPHFVSNTPSRQAKGFIFSDNFRAGLLLPVQTQLSLNLSTGIRHISNAGLKRPNKGIDNVLVGFGVKYTRQKRRM